MRAIKFLGLFVNLFLLLGLFSGLVLSDDTVETTFKVPYTAVSSSLSSDASLFLQANVAHRFNATYTGLKNIRFEVVDNKGITAQMFYKLDGIAQKPDYFLIQATQSDVGKIIKLRVYGYKVSDNTKIEIVKDFKIQIINDCEAGYGTCIDTDVYTCPGMTISSSCSGAQNSVSSSFVNKGQNSACCPFPSAQIKEKEGDKTIVVQLGELASQMSKFDIYVRKPGLFFGGTSIPYYGPVTVDWNSADVVIKLKDVYSGLSSSEFVGNINLNSLVGSYTYYVPSNFLDDFYFKNFVVTLNKAIGSTAKYEFCYYANGKNDCKDLTKTTTFSNFVPLGSDYVELKEIVSDSVTVVRSFLAKPFEQLVSQIAYTEPNAADCELMLSISPSDSNAVVKIDGVVVNGGTATVNARESHTIDVLAEGFVVNKIEGKDVLGEESFQISCADGPRIDISLSEQRYYFVFGDASAGTLLVSDSNLRKNTDYEVKFKHSVYTEGTEVSCGTYKVDSALSSTVIPFSDCLSSARSNAVEFKIPITVNDPIAFQRSNPTYSNGFLDDTKLGDKFKCGSSEVEITELKTYECTLNSDDDYARVVFDVGNIGICLDYKIDGELNPSLVSRAQSSYNIELISICPYVGVTGSPYSMDLVSDQDFDISRIIGQYSIKFNLDVDYNQTHSKQISIDYAPNPTFNYRSRIVDVLALDSSHDCSGNSIFLNDFLTTGKLSLSCSYSVGTPLRGYGQEYDYLSLTSSTLKPDVAGLRGTDLYEFCTTLTLSSDSGRMSGSCDGAMLCSDISAQSYEVDQTTVETHILNNRNILDYCSISGSLTFDLVFSYAVFVKSVGSFSIPSMSITPTDIITVTVAQSNLNDLFSNDDFVVEYKFDSAASAPVQTVKISDVVDAISSGRAIQVAVPSVGGDLTRDSVTVKLSGVENYRSFVDFVAISGADKFVLTQAENVLRGVSTIDRVDFKVKNSKVTLDSGYLEACGLNNDVDGSPAVYSYTVNPACTDKILLSVSPFSSEAQSLVTNSLGSPGTFKIEGVEYSGNNFPLNVNGKTAKVVSGSSELVIGPVSLQSYNQDFIFGIEDVTSLANRIVVKLQGKFPLLFGPDAIKFKVEGAVFDKNSAIGNPDGPCEGKFTKTSKEALCKVVPSSRYTVEFYDEAKPEEIKTKLIVPSTANEVFELDLGDSLTEVISTVLPVAYEKGGIELVGDSSCIAGKCYGKNNFEFKFLSNSGLSYNGRNKYTFAKKDFANVDSLLQDNLKFDFNIVLSNLAGVKKDKLSSITFNSVSLLSVTNTKNPNVLEIVSKIFDVFEELPANIYDIELPVALRYDSVDYSTKLKFIDLFLQNSFVIDGQVQTQADGGLAYLSILSQNLLSAGKKFTIVSGGKQYEISVVSAYSYSVPASYYAGQFIQVSPLRLKITNVNDGYSTEVDVPLTSSDFTEALENSDVVNLYKTITATLSKDGEDKRVETVTLSLTGTMFTAVGEGSSSRMNFEISSNGITIPSSEVCSSLNVNFKGAVMHKVSGSWVEVDSAQKQDYVNLIGYSTVVTPSGVINSNTQYGSIVVTITSSLFKFADATSSKTLTNVRVSDSCSVDILDSINYTGTESDSQASVNTCGTVGATFVFKKGDQTLSFGSELIQHLPSYKVCALGTTPLCINVGTGTKNFGLFDSTGASKVTSTYFDFTDSTSQELASDCKIAFTVEVKDVCTNLPSGYTDSQSRNFYLVGHRYSLNSGSVDSFYDIKSVNGNDCVIEVSQGQQTECSLDCKLLTMPSDVTCSVDTDYASSAQIPLKYTIRYDSEKFEEKTGAIGNSCSGVSCSDGTFEILKSSINNCYFNVVDYLRTPETPVNHCLLPEGFTDPENRNYYIIGERYNLCTAGTSDCKIYTISSDCNAQRGEVDGCSFDSTQDSVLRKVFSLTLENGQCKVGARFLGDTKYPFSTGTPITLEMIRTAVGSKTHSVYIDKVFPSVADGCVRTNVGDSTPVGCVIGSSSLIPCTSFPVFSDRDSSSNLIYGTDLVLKYADWVGESIFYSCNDNGVLKRDTVAFHTKVRLDINVALLLSSLSNLEEGYLQIPHYADHSRTYDFRYSQILNVANGATLSKLTSGTLDGSRSFAMECDLNCNLLNLPSEGVGKVQCSVDTVNKKYILNYDSGYYKALVGESTGTLEVTDFTNCYFDYSTKLEEKESVIAQEDTELCSLPVALQDKVDRTGQIVYIKGNKYELCENDICSLYTFGDDCSVTKVDESTTIPVYACDSYCNKLATNAFGLPDTIGCTYISDSTTYSITYSSEFYDCKSEYQEVCGSTNTFTVARTQGTACSMDITKYLTGKESEIEINDDQEQGVLQTDANGCIVYNFRGMNAIAFSSDATKSECSHSQACSAYKTSDNKPLSWNDRSNCNNINYPLIDPVTYSVLFTDSQAGKICCIPNVVSDCEEKSIQFPKVQEQIVNGVRSVATGECEYSYPECLSYKTTDGKTYSWQVDEYEDCDERYAPLDLAKVSPTGKGNNKVCCVARDSCEKEFGSGYFKFDATTRKNCINSTVKTDKSCCREKLCDGTKDWTTTQCDVKDYGVPPKVLPNGLTMYCCNRSVTSGLRNALSWSEAIEEGMRDAQEVCGALANTNQGSSTDKKAPAVFWDNCWDAISRSSVDTDFTPGLISRCDEWGGSPYCVGVTRKVRDLKRGIYSYVSLADRIGIGAVNSWIAEVSADSGYVDNMLTAIDWIGGGILPDNFKSVDAMDSAFRETALYQSTLGVWNTMIGDLSESIRAMSPSAQITAFCEGDGFYGFPTDNLLGLTTMTDDSNDLVNLLVTRQPYMDEIGSEKDNQSLYVYIFTWMIGGFEQNISYNVWLTNDNSNSDILSEDYCFKRLNETEYDDSGVVVNKNTCLGFNLVEGDSHSTPDTLKGRFLNTEYTYACIRYKDPDGTAINVPENDDTSNLFGGNAPFFSADYWSSLGDHLSGLWGGNDSCIAQAFTQKDPFEYQRTNSGQGNDFICVSINDNGLGVDETDGDAYGDPYYVYSHTGDTTTDDTSSSDDGGEDFESTDVATA
ncbi:hypothetical protein JXM83_01085 [Candidatus Woesearchaeota archaeon]|nr:hypothetical protein [Candidatus Woesearchaeota archaeon]